MSDRFGTEEEILVELCCTLQEMLIVLKYGNQQGSHKSGESWKSPLRQSCPANIPGKSRNFRILARVVEFKKEVCRTFKQARKCENYGSQKIKSVPEVGNWIPDDENSKVLF